MLLDADSLISLSGLGALGAYVIPQAYTNQIAAYSKHAAADNAAIAKLQAKIDAERTAYAKREAEKAAREAEAARRRAESAALARAHKDEAAVRLQNAARVRDQSRAERIGAWMAQYGSKYPAEMKAWLAQQGLGDLGVPVAPWFREQYRRQFRDRPRPNRPGYNRPGFRRGPQLTSGPALSGLGDLPEGLTDADLTAAAKYLWHFPQAETAAAQLNAAGDAMRGDATRAQLRLQLYAAQRALRGVPLRGDALLVEPLVRRAMEMIKSTDASQIPAGLLQALKTANSLAGDSGVEGLGAGPAIIGAAAAAVYIIVALLALATVIVISATGVAIVWRLTSAQQPMVIQDASGRQSVVVPPGSGGPFTELADLGKWAIYAAGLYMVWQVVSPKVRGAVERIRA